MQYKGSTVDLIESIGAEKMKPIAEWHASRSTTDDRIECDQARKALLEHRQPRYEILQAVISLS